jgi:3-methyladenine DNA glycosylase AlkD
MAMTSSATKSIVALLKSQSDPKYATKVVRFFKMEPGEYSHGDQFLGLRQPVIRQALKDTYADLCLSDAEDLMKSEWHELRMYGCLWMAQCYTKAKKQRGESGSDERRKVYEAYIRCFDGLNNWDLVDVSAPKVTGEHLVGEFEYDVAIEQIHTWCAHPTHLWTRRIGMLSTFPFIRESQFEPTLSACRLLLDSGESEDLMHKASGWMLREVGKRDQGALTQFLDENAARMPRVMLRYALEKLAPETRRTYMAMKAAS